MLASTMQFSNNNPHHHHHQHKASDYLKQGILETTLVVPGPNSAPTPRKNTPHNTFQPHKGAYSHHTVRQLSEPNQGLFFDIPPMSKPRAIHSITNWADPTRVQLLRKEVIQPHLPVRLPCYDLVPIASPTFDHSPRKTGWAVGFGCYQLS